MFNDAIEHFEKALLIDPDNYSTNNQLGGIYKEKNNYDKALEYYTNLHIKIPINTLCIYGIQN